MLVSLPPPSYWTDSILNPLFSLFLKDVVPWVLSLSSLITLWKLVAEWSVDPFTKSFLLATKAI